jgi:hypothetical protein
MNRRTFLSSTASGLLAASIVPMRARGVNVRFVRVKGERIIDIQPAAAADDS